jgi:4-diphosphocytidyl-2-C-methyl-D-erythritol kinase
VSGGSERAADARSEVHHLTAPAKLTVSLRITGVRLDGYHLLESEMVSLDLADTLVLAPGSGLTVEMLADPTIAAELGGIGGPDTPGGPSGPDREEPQLVPEVVPGWMPRTVGAGPGNLVSRALAVTGRSASVRLLKRIPPGAGLGGGSADAAAVLRWAGQTDVTLAAGLGADVPFCLTGGRALVRGIGDQVEPLPFEERSYVLLLLPFGVDTAAVYGAWDELVDRGEVAAPWPVGEVHADPGHNDLEVPALVVEPRLAPWRRVFEEATGRTARMAGSGSTFFVEGSPDEVGLANRRTLSIGGETALVVPVRTTRAINAV